MEGREYMEFLEAPPSSTFFVILLALLISLATTLLNRKFVNRRLLAEWRKEMAEWRAESELARKTGDKKLMAKLKKQEVKIMQMGAKVSAQQTKASLITFIPLLVVWWALLPFLHKPAAFIPLLGTRFEVPFFLWYIICNFFFNFALSKIFGVGIGIGAEA